MKNQTFFILEIIGMIVITTSLLSIPFWITAKLKKRSNNFNFWCPFVPVSFWVILTAAGVGAQSLSNFIEILVINIFTLITCTSVLILHFWSLRSRKGKVFTLIILLLFTILIRLFMPIIPE
jgi:hypothetical protein